MSVFPSRPASLVFSVLCSLISLLSGLLSLRLAFLLIAVLRPARELFLGNYHDLIRSPKLPTRTKMPAVKEMSDEQPRSGQLLWFENARG